MIQEYSKLASCSPERVNLQSVRSQQGDIDLVGWIPADQLYVKLQDLQLEDQSESRSWTLILDAFAMAKSTKL